MKESGDGEGSWPSLRSFEEPPYPEASNPQMTMSQEEKTEQIIIDAKNKYLFESHKPPIVYGRHQHGFRVQDMDGNYYHDVNNLIMKHMSSDPLLKTIKDPEAVDLYLTTLMSWYPKTQSLLAVKEGSREVIGVLIGRLVVEDNWFELLSEIPFVQKKDKYAYLKQGIPTEGGSAKSAKGGRSMKKDSKRASKVSRRSSKRQSQVNKAGGSRKSMGAKGGSRKSMGAKGGGQRKSMGAKGGGQRKSMGAKGGQRKSMGAKGGQRKSMGAKGGQRKSMGSKGGQRKSMGGQRKSMGGKRKSMGGKSVKSGKGGKLRPQERKKGDAKVPRPVDVIPEELVPVVQAVVFDDDGVTFQNKELQYMLMFKKKLADRFRIWKLFKQRMYYRIYLVAVSPKYERQEIDKALFKSLRHMCFAFNIQAIAGVLTTYSAQNAFYDIGGLIVYEILYKHYPKFESSDPKSYDRSAAVMFLELTPLSNPTLEPPPTRVSISGKPKGK